MTEPSLAILEALAGNLASGRTTSRALTEACLAHAEDADGEGRRAFISINRVAALASADAADLQRRSNRAPSRWAGIPISIKDLFDAAGEVTKAGSTALRDAPPATRTAPAIERLIAAGFVIVGRTNMTEFAFSGLGLNPHYGTPRNPYDRKTGRIPGGSSSGAAISVTERMAHAGIGTDTGGSCRIPAALNGIVGYKPTARRVPREGALPLSTTLDSVGPLARSVSCCSIIDSILSGDRSSDLVPLSANGIRLAVAEGVVLDGMDGHVARDYERALHRIGSAGAQLTKLRVAEFDRILDLNSRPNLQTAEAFAWHRPLIARKRAEYDPRVLSRILRGEPQTAADYIDLLEARRGLIASFSRLMSPFDALVLPTTPIIAPLIADLADDANYWQANGLMLRNPSLANFLDGCAISIPMHGPGAAPTGLMLMAPGGRDSHLFAVAAGIEKVLTSSTET